jgi:hypothetical protein
MAIDRTVNLAVIVAERNPVIIAKVRAIAAAFQKPVADVAHAVAEVTKRVVLTDPPALAAEFERTHRAGTRATKRMRKQ